MKMLRWFMLFLLFFSSIAIVSAQERCVEYFQGTGCPHCALAEPTIEKIREAGVQVNVYDIYAERAYAALLDNSLAQRGIPQQERGVPALLVANLTFIGDQPIITNTQTILENAGPCPLAQTEETNAEQTSVTMAALIGAAFVDSINPCAIAVILILMGGLVAVGERKRALLAGLSFTTAVYIVYLLLGLGIFSALHITGIAGWFAKAVGVLAILIGLMNIKDYFWYGGAGFVAEIPRAWRPTIKKLLGAVTSPAGAFAAGMLVCLFELPCTGGPYLFVLGLLADSSTTAQAIPLLLLYNAVFVIPLVFITLLLFFGFSTVEKATEWKERNIRVLHLIAGIIMLALGLLVLFY